MKNHPARRHIPRPLLIASAVGLVCQTAYAQTVVDLSQTPFASRPLHLEQSATNSGIPGVKPNVLFFVDDSGSMGSTVPNSGGLSRIAVVRGALTNILNTYQDQMRWNILSLWGTENSPRQEGATHPFMTAAQLQPMVNRLQEWGWTPTTYRYFQAVRVLRDGIQYRCQKNYVVVLSDGDANRGNSQIAGLPSFLPWETALHGTFSNPQNNRGNGAFPGDMNWNERGQYTDANNNLYFTYINGLDNGIARFSHKLAATDLRVAAGPTDRDAEGGYWDYNDTDPNPIMQNTQFDKQTIETFVIGFRDGLSTAGRGYLVDAATCERSTSETNKLNVCWFPVSTAADVGNAFDRILQQISAANSAIQPSTAYSASTPSSTGSTIAELAASLSLDTGTWSSRLRFVEFDAAGSLTNNLKDASYNNRRVLVNNGLGAVYWLETAPAARKADFGITNNAEFTDAFVPWLVRSVNKSDAQVEVAAAAVPSAQRTVTKYRERAVNANDPERQMADVISTPVVAMGKISSTDNKQKYVITAANDGMAYIFSATGSGTTSPYDLVLNYLPAGMQRESALPPSDPGALTVGKTIRATAEDDYGKNDTTNPHVYLNNGGLSWVRTPKTGNRNQQEILLGTMGQGGRGAYALTVAGDKRSNTTPNVPTGLDAAPSQWSTEVPLWETDKSASNALGYTISTGLVGQIAANFPNLQNDVHLYAFIPNGYPSGEASVPYDSSPTLYVYDMMGQEFGLNITATTGNISNGNQPGTLITKIPTANSAGALASPALFDSNRDGIVDFAYAGDSHGDLHRFDLRGAPAGWTSTKIYDGNSDQPITSAPSLHRISDDKHVVIFGTGSDIYSTDRTTLDTQIVMGIHEDLTNPSSTPLTPTSAGIVDQTMSYPNNPSDPNYDPSNSSRYVSYNTFTVGTDRAWRLTLEPGVKVSDDDITSSERVVSKPQLLTRTLFLTTRIYKFKKSATTLPGGVSADHTCYSTSSQIETGGTSWLMAIDAVTGAGPAVGDSAANTQGAYFQSSDATAGAVGTGGVDNRRVVSGINLGYLSSAPALVNTKGAGSNHLQVNPQGELGYSGEITMAGTVDTRDPTCVPQDEAYSLLIAKGGVDPGQTSNLDLHELIYRSCRPLSQGKTLIRVDWRQVPL